MQVNDTRGQKLIVRGYKDKQVVFEDKFVFAILDLDRLLQTLAQEHDDKLDSGEVDMVEVEFLDEPDPSRRFVRRMANDPEENDGITIICEFADAPNTIAGSVYTHKCGKCSRLVMLSPRGQDVLRRYPEAKILCKACGMTGDFVEADSNCKALFEPGDETQVIPNMRLYRN